MNGQNKTVSDQDRAVEDAISAAMQKSLDKNKREVPLPEDAQNAPKPEPKGDDRPKQENAPEPKPEPKKVDLPGDDAGLNLNGVLDDVPVMKEPEKKVEDVHVDESTKVGRAFAAMRRQIKDLEAQLAGARQVQSEELLELKDAKEQIGKKDEEIAKLLDQIAALDLARDPRFQAKYKAEEDLIMSQVNEVAKELGISEEALTESLSMPLAKRKEYLRDEAGQDVTELSYLLAQRDLLMRRKSEELAKHKETRELLDQQRGMQDLALEQQARQRLFESALSDARQNGHFVFIDVPGNEGRSALVSKMTEMAKGLFTSSDGEAQARAMLQGVAAPIYLRMLYMERQARLKAENELAKRFGKTPGVRGDRGITTDTGEVPQSMTAAEAAKSIMADIMK